MTDGAAMFPDVSGRDLLGRAYHLPGELPATVTVAVLAFKQWQQRQVDAWIDRLGDAGIAVTPHGQADLDAVVVEIPVLPGRYQLFRRFIDGGMAASIGDPAVLARTITLYGSVDAVCEPLRIRSRVDVSVRVVTRDGRVLWGTTGPVREEAVQRILPILNH